MRHSRGLRALAFPWQVVISFLGAGMQQGARSELDHADFGILLGCLLVTSLSLMAPGNRHTQFKGRKVLFSLTVCRGFSPSLAGCKAEAQARRAG